MSLMNCFLSMACQPSEYGLSEIVAANVAENGSISPQWHHTTCEHQGGRPKFNHGQTMAEK